MIVLCFAASLGAESTPRGYQSRACGFDLDRDGIRGESEDCRVCNGTTSDPDGDGVDEDLIYVDCQKGRDDAACGTPDAPCQTIGHAWTQRADGPADGAEDIVCFRGVCREDDLRPSVAGLAGDYTVAKTGSQARDWRYPDNPTMLVGWDHDADGSYPPHDPDDLAVLTGVTRAIRLNAHNDHVEIAHFTARDFGSATDVIDSGFLRLGPSEGVLEHVYVHDLELIDINRARVTELGTSSSISVFNIFSARTRPKWIAVENVLVDNNGDWFVRGEAIADAIETGPYRFQHITRRLRGCNADDCGKSAAATSFRIWGYVTGIEILDSIWDAQVAAWQPWAEGPPMGARFVSAGPCSRDWTIRNNHVLDHKVALDVYGHSPGYCEDEHAREVTDVVFDANEVINHHEPWRYGDVMVNLFRGGDSPGETIGDVILTDNLFVSTVGWEGGVWIRHGHQSQPLTGTITLIGNIFRGAINRSGHGVIMLGGEDYPYRPRNLVIENNRFEEAEGREFVEMP